MKVTTVPSSPASAKSSGVEDALDALQRLLAHNAAATAALATHHDVTPVHLRALLVLAARGPLTASRLGAAVGLSSGAVTPLVDRLERSGHAARRPTLVDRRTVVVTALPAGLDVAAHLRASFAKVIARAFPDDLDQVVHVLKSLSDALEVEVAAW